MPTAGLAVLLAGWGEWRRGSPWQWKALGVWALALAGWALSVYYFVDYQRPGKHPPAHELKAVYEASVQFLLGGFGHAAPIFWPECKNVVVAALVAVGIVLLYVVLFRPLERERALRLLLFLGGMVSLALGLAWARSALGDDMMWQPRYPTLAAPLWCGFYLAWEIFDRPQLRRFAQTAVFFATAAMAVQNHEMGRVRAQDHRAAVQSIVDDIHKGVPLAQIIQRHGGFTYYGGADVLRDRMRMLHARGIGPFRELKE
jgi:hypothetical protein